MSIDNIDNLDQPVLSRQQRIADVLRSTLPHIEAGQRRERFLRRTSLLVALSLFLQVVIRLASLSARLATAKK